MRLLIAMILAALPLANAFAQRESPFAVYLFGSLADDRTTRPSSFNPNCWESRTVGGAGVDFEYTTPVSLTVQAGWHYLGYHKNKNCFPGMELWTSVIPVTLGYAFQLGPRIVVTPKLGLASMQVNGTFNGQDSSDRSVKPTYGLAVEGRLHRHWGLRGEVNRYTGTTSLFGAEGFHQDFRVVQFGGVFRW